MPDFSRLGASVAKALDTGLGAKLIEQAGEAAGRFEELGAKLLQETLPATKAAKSRVPDVVRPTLEHNVPFSAQDFTEAARSYRKGIVELKYAPATRTGQANETIETAATRLLHERGPVTGELPTAGNIKREVSYLAWKNPELKGVSSWEGQSFTAYDEARVHSIASGALMNKHVPQTGQLLKSMGKVTEEQIESAVAHQKTLSTTAPRRMLEQILQDRGLVTAEDVVAARGTQKALQEFLRQNSRDLLPG